MVFDYTQAEWTANPGFKGILEGEGKVLYDDGEEAVKAGMIHYCPEGHSHSLINSGSEDLIFAAVVPVQ